MKDRAQQADPKSRPRPQEAFAKERAGFKALLLSNPNYFGNLTDSPLKAVAPIAGNTYYEELGCVGYHPQQRQLEGVVYIYQPSGYGTDVCGPGTTEFVRFYLSFDHGATWQDQGLTSFQAFNIPAGTEGGKRLEYAVSLTVNPPRKLCLFDPLIHMRAILSWNNPPPPNQPNWTPVWGNVRDAAIEVDPRRWLFSPELFELVKLPKPYPLPELLDPEVPIATAAKSLSLAERTMLYKGEDVPVHRFAFPELAAFTSGAAKLGVESVASLLPGIVLNPDIITALFPTTDGNTTYEELRCIGLDPNHPDTMVGVIQVKKASGYSGGPCTQGSLEYVTFWADFDGNGSFETCLGTAEVRVHDLSKLPPEGAHYAVRLPVDLHQYRQPCRRGPKVVRVRAILSWSHPAPCSNPGYVPVWGNREETLIHIAPVEGAPAGKIAILGGIPVSMIGPVDGLTTATAVFATNNLPPDALGRPCPFGGRVTAQGVPVLGSTYMVEVSPDGTIWTPVLTDLVVTDQNGFTSVHKADPITKRFSYLPFNQNINSLLAQWNTAGNDKWQVRLSVYSAGGVLQSQDAHAIQLDNTAPDASIVITSGAGNCGKFSAGTVLAGTFVARDLYLARYSLAVEPTVNPPGVGIPSPNSGTVNTSVSGDAWTLNTAGMRPCGYVIRVVAVDRAILNSQSVGHYSSASAGFCVEAP